MVSSASRQLLRNLPSANKLWWGILVFLVLQTVWVGYLLGTVISTNPANVSDGEKITTIIIISVIFLMVVGALWGAYQIQKWTIVLLWLIVLGALITLAWVSIVVNFIVAISYHYILGRLNRESAES